MICACTHLDITNLPPAAADVSPKASSGVIAPGSSKKGKSKATSSHSSTSAVAGSASCAADALRVCCSCLMSMRALSACPRLADGSTHLQESCDAWPVGRCTLGSLPSGFVRIDPTGLAACSHPHRVWIHGGTMCFFWIDWMWSCGRVALLNTVESERKLAPSLHMVCAAYAAEEE